jgi:hypothetical protein
VDESGVFRSRHIITMALHVHISPAGSRSSETLSQSIVKLASKDGLWTIKLVQFRRHEVCVVIMWQAAYRFDTGVFITFVGDRAEHDYSLRQHKDDPPNCRPRYNKVQTARAV